MMIHLIKSARAWSSSDFETILKNEVTALGLTHLPLQEGLSASSIALDHNLQLIVLQTRENNNIATVKMGAFYSGIIAGCSCADDPTPTDEVNEYCELEVYLNLANGHASVALSAGAD
jgi:hypothetical protein